MMLNALLATGDGALPEDDRLNLASQLRALGEEQSRELDRVTFARIATLDTAVREAKSALAKQHEMLRKLMAAPWYPALFLSATRTSEGERAIVIHGPSRRVVALRDGLNVADIKAGEEVYLSESANVIMEHNGVRPLGGELAIFERRLPDGRLVVRSRDEELIVESLLDAALPEPATGDLVRFDRQFNFAFEMVAKPDRHSWLRDDAPSIAREQIGGQEECVEELLDALTVTLIDPECAARFGLGGRSSILLHGRPGCGKTLMARFAVSEVARLSGKKCKFVAVSPAQWFSPWVGTTEKTIRDLFKGLREAADRDNFVVAYLDEIDAVGRTRGSGDDPHTSRFLNVLLSEIDGFTALGNVAFICATNRLDTLDPALLERLAATQIAVPRPNRRSAQSIFGVHLPATLPFHPNGSEAPATREQLIDAGVTQLFAPNADNAVCLVRFRDGKDRTVTAKELISGRLIMQLCEDARRSAFRHARRTGEVGLRLEDIEGATARTIDRMRTSLSLHNIHSQLDGLPQDVAAVSVQPLGGKVKNASRYLRS